MLKLKTFATQSHKSSASCLKVRKIIERLEAGDSDSDVLVDAIWPYFLGERARSRVARGKTTTLFVEGPYFVTGPLTLPLGAQLDTDLGWINLGPLDAQEIVDREEEALDAAHFRFLCEHQYFSKASPFRHERERPLDDMLALREMEVACKLRTAPAPQDAPESAGHE